VAGGHVYVDPIGPALAIILVSFGISYIVHIYFHVEGDFRITMTIVMAVLTAVYIAYELLTESDNRGSSTESPQATTPSSPGRLQSGDSSPSWGLSS